MKKIIMISTVMLSLLTAPVVLAKQHHNDNKQLVKVTKVQPIKHVVNKRVTHVIYKKETVRYKQSNHKRYNHKNYKNRNYVNHNHNSNQRTYSDDTIERVVVGGVIGGAVGNKISHNK